MVTTTRVVHSAPVWLPQTQTWMYTQASSLPGWVENHVACESTQNLDQFGPDQFDRPHIHALSRGSKLYHFWDRLVRGAGLRHYLGHLPRVIRGVGAHLLHSHFGHIGWTNLGAVRKQKVPHVVTYYGQDLSYLPRQQPAWHDRYRDMFGQVQKVLCEGPHMAKRVVEMGCPEHKVQVHHLGVDMQALRFEPRLWDGNTPLRVLIAGSFTEKKGFPDAIRALGILKDRLDLQITMIGDASAQPRNQEEKRRILAAIDESGLRQRVTLLGYQPYSRLLTEAYDHHLFLSPSVTAQDGDTEGGAPVTIIEMAATGMPIISTQHCDIPEVIPKDICGLLADEHDPDQLAGHVSQLADAPQSWKPMASAARRHLEHHYDLRKQGEALGCIYRSILEPAAGP